jgi:tetratricopeptide (TPR) repeat protein
LLPRFLQFGLVSEWFESRDYKDLLFGMPVLFCFIALIVAGAFAFRPVDPMSWNEFANASSIARAEGKNEVADLYARKASLVQPKGIVSRYRQAVFLGNNGHEDLAANIMGELAPTNVPGYAPAHQWLASAYLRRLSKMMKANTSGDEGRTSPPGEQFASMVKVVEAHAQQILKTKPKDTFALNRLAMLRLDRNDSQGALKYLEALVSVRPSANLLYANVLASVGKKTQAAAAAQTAVNHFTAQLRKGNFSEAERIQYQSSLASGFVLTKRYKQAVEALLVDGKLPPDPTRRKAVGQIYYAWSISYKDSDTNLSRQLSLLDNALMLLPNDPRVLARVAEIAVAPGEAGERAIKAINKVIVEGNAPTIVHLVLGINASRVGKENAAQTHFELANRASPNTPVTLNNLAFVLASQRNPDLPRALSLVDRAIELNPQLIEIYDTRGQIFIAMERWVDGIADLERALRGGASDQARIHHSLAKAYAATENETLAAMHESKAAQLDKSTAPRSR